MIKQQGEYVTGGESLNVDLTSEFWANFEVLGIFYFWNYLGCFVLFLLLG